MPPMSRVMWVFLSELGGAEGRVPRLKTLPSGVDTSGVNMATSEHRRRPPSQWLVLALALFLVLTAAAVSWVLVQNATSSSSIRLEAQKELLVSDMVSAVQVESERAGMFAGQIAGMTSMGVDTMESMTEGDMSEMDMPESDPGGLLTDDPDLLVAIASFGEAAGSLRHLIPDSGRPALEDVVTAHNDFVASLAALDVQVQSGQNAMSLYHDTTQVLEAALRTSLQDLQSVSSIRLQSSIDDASSTETLLRWSVPSLLLAGLVAAFYLLRMQATKRRVDILEHMVEVKGEFIATISHELRTPLTAVKGFADLLLESGAGFSPSDRADMLAAIAEQSQEVSTIVDDLLVAARADIGELTVAAVPINLRAQAAQVLEIVDQDKSIGVHGEAPKASGDPARVRQILRNLFTNAKRYGGDHISVDLGSHSDGLASLVVRDDGDPIPEEDRERIFESYQRAHNQPGMAESIGIGLAVSRRLARLMNGDLTYRHQDGHSVFELSLPLDVPSDMESHRETAAPAAAAR